MPETLHPSLLRNRYLRAQVVALLATGIDFSVTALLAETGLTGYVLAVAAGAACGAVTAFLLNRSWVFVATQASVRGQAARFAVALAGSALLNTSGTYLVTETLGSHYLLSKAGVAVCIGLTYSYFILRFFVFAYEKK